MIRGKTGLLQWKKTDAVTSWFQNLHIQDQCQFFTFDIVDFYPSISEKLLENAISFAKQHADVGDKIVEIIQHCRKSMLVTNDATWVKNTGSLFDVTMSSFDGAEICDLVGLFLLHKLQVLFGKGNVGLYRDDGLAVLNNQPGPQSKRTRKRLIKLFQMHGLEITSESNLIQVNFLDVTLNLKILALP